MNIIFIADPLINSIGSLRPPILLARALQQIGHTTTVLAYSIGDEVQKIVDEYKLVIKSFGNRIHVLQSIPFLEAWARSLFKNEMKLPQTLSKHHSMIINMSSCVKVRATIYYGQGATTKALDDMLYEMPKHYRLVYHLSHPILRYLDRKSIRDYSQLSSYFIANSSFCASMYVDWGFKVDEVIPPPLDRQLFKPHGSRPTEDYVLTYFGVYGKETKFSVVERIANAGIKIKAFGYKTHKVPASILKCPNIEFLGKVSSDELAVLYSNALYTLFTFTHEPFGYIPIESMACGTPVLTYNSQGPSESVVNGSTGWLVNSDEEIIKKALSLWRMGYDQSIRKKCRNTTSQFDIEYITERWINVIKNFI